MGAGSGSTIDLDTVVKGLSSLGLLGPKVASFGKAFDTTIFFPYVQTDAKGTTGRLAITSNAIQVTGGEPAKSTAYLLDVVNEMLEYLSLHIPDSIQSRLWETLIPKLISRLLSGPLASAVPPDLEGIPAFQATLKRAIAFSESLEPYGGFGKRELLRWAHRAPKVWLETRSESSLNSIRQLFKRGLGNPRAVERVETQVITREDTVFAADAKADDWDAGWDDGDDANQAQPSSNGHNLNEEEDVSAWGFDEDKTEAEKPASGVSEISQTNDDDNDGEAWGWGDENDNLDSPQSVKQPTPKAAEAPKENVDSTLAVQQGPAEREVTLRETYHITALPEQVLEIIIQVVEDAESLARSEYVYIVTHYLRLTPKAVHRIQWHQPPLTSSPCLVPSSLCSAPPPRAPTHTRPTATCSSTTTAST